MKENRRLSLLEGKTMALFMTTPSLQTRVCFEMAMHRLSGHFICLSPADTALNRDTARRISRYVNVMTVCGIRHKTVIEFSRHAEIPIINTLDSVESPCQVLGDLLTVFEKKDGMEGLTISYIGNGSPLANSLMLDCALMGVHFKMAAPAGYQVAESCLDTARELASGSRAEMVCTTSLPDAAADAEVIYAGDWTTTAQPEEMEALRRAMTGYRVTRSVMKLAKTDAIFIHPCPACHGDEADDDVFYSPHPVVFDQSENGQHVIKALLAEMLGGLDVFLNQHK